MRLVLTCHLVWVKRNRRRPMEKGEGKNGEDEVDARCSESEGERPESVEDMEDC